MHLDLHQIHISRSSSARRTHTDPPDKSARPIGHPHQPAHGDRLDHACWLGSAGEPSRCCPPWCGTQPPTCHSSRRRRRSGASPCPQLSGAGQLCCLLDEAAGTGRPWSWIRSAAGTSLALSWPGQGRSDEPDRESQGDELDLTGGQ